MAKIKKSAADDPMGTLKKLGAKISPALTRPGPLRMTSRDCVICGPRKDCDCASVKFGSPEYLRRQDAAHGRKR